MCLNIKNLVNRDGIKRKTMDEILGVPTGIIRICESISKVICDR
jgi:hypothetical protein